MGDMKDYFEPYKEKHRQRMAKNPERIAYAIQQLDAQGKNIRSKSFYTEYNKLAPPAIKNGVLKMKEDEING